MASHERQRDIAAERGVESYRCGLRAGDRIELRKPLTIQDHTGKLTGEVYVAGEVWTVLPGSVNDPGVLWLRRADGERHTWDDDPAEVGEWFRRLDDPPPQRTGDAGG